MLKYFKSQVAKKADMYLKATQMMIVMIYNHALFYFRRRCSINQMVFFQFSNYFVHLLAFLKTG